MNDDLPHPAGQPHYPSVGVDAPPPAIPAAGSTSPAGAFTAGVLLDVLSQVAENPDQARTYTRRAVDLLRVGLGTSLATFALNLLDALNIPAATPAGKAATKALALEGAILAVYLLNLAARQKQLGDTALKPGVADAAPIGLSLTGLALLGASGKLK